MRRAWPQNNLHELYALLSYLYPDVFTTAQPFDDAFNLTLHKVSGQTAPSKKMNVPKHSTFQPPSLNNRCT